MSRTRRGVLAGTVVALAGCNDGRTGVSIEFQSVDTSAVSGRGMPVDTTGELSTDAIGIHRSRR